jgi:hypothetical protein
VLIAVGLKTKKIEEILCLAIFDFDSKGTSAPLHKHSKWGEVNVATEKDFYLESNDRVAGYGGREGA